MWAELTDEPHVVRLANTPFFVRGVAWGDEMRIRQVEDDGGWEYESLLRESAIQRCGSPSMTRRARQRSMPSWRIWVAMGGRLRVPEPDRGQRPAGAALWRASGLAG
ncbi:hypothetical protein AB0K12_36700 [Nonomuraea sp. NPDC049419]|uniref:hypothetical protein n=1 Tax=Nonomuraea sp. NPDC049419 TaxID=3155772 RepID=UPI0034469F39